VESTYAPALQPTRWRTATIVVSLLAAIELAGLLAIGVAVLGKSVAHQVRNAAIQQVAGPALVAKPKPAPPGKPQLTRADTGVLVLNGGGVSGAAATAADRVRRHGYLIGGVGNAPRVSALQQTTIMYSGAYRPEALRLAKDLRVRAVAPLDGIKQSALMGAQLVLLVGR
jgi:hypothetical protein